MYTFCLLKQLQYRIIQVGLQSPNTGILNGGYCMKTGITNPTKKYNERLVALYRTKHIDVINERGWALRVAKEMYDTGILEHDDYKPHKNAETDVTDTKIHNHSNTKHLLQGHVNGKNISIDWIKNYCIYFGCSSDYLLGFIDTPTHTQYDDIPLKLETIQALKRIQKNYLEQGYMCFVAAMHQIQKQPYQPLDMLNYLLQSPDFEKMLYSLEDYFKPEYNIPVFYLDANQSPTGKAGYHVPHNQIHEIVKRDDKGKVILNDNLMPEYDRYLPLAKNASVPTDNRPIPINDSFMENVAMLDIQKAIDNMKKEYLKAQSNAPAATATKKKNRKGITNHEKH